MRLPLITKYVPVKDIFFAAVLSISTVRRTLGSSAERRSTPLRRRTPPGSATSAGEIVSGTSLRLSRGTGRLE